MTPQEKAEQLIRKFNNDDWQRCSLIAVNEIIHYLTIVLGVDKEDFEYWQQVKEEINKL